MKMLTPDLAGGSEIAKGAWGGQREPQGRRAAPMFHSAPAWMWEASLDSCRELLAEVSTPLCGLLATPFSLITSRGGRGWHRSRNLELLGRKSLTHTLPKQEGFCSLFLPKPHHRNTSCQAEQIFPGVAWAGRAQSAGLCVCSLFPISLCSLMGTQSRFSFPSPHEGTKSDSTKL